MGVLRVLENGAWKDVYPAQTNPNPGNVFANAAARDAALPDVTEGVTCWLLDLHQQQVYSAGTGWIPTGGRLPYGLTAGSAAQAFTPGWQKATFSDPSPLLGGLGWDSAKNCYIIPVTGVYLVWWRFGPASLASASTVGIATGSSSAYSSIWDTAVINASTSITTGGSLLSQWGAGAEVALWFNTSTSRDIGNKLFRITYIGDTS